MIITPSSGEKLCATWRRGCTAQQGCSFIWIAHTYILFPKYYPAYVAPPAAAVAPGAEGEDDDDCGSGDEYNDIEASTVQCDEVQPGAAAEEFTPKFINKLREGAYGRRQRAIELQAVNEGKIWALMWSLMSLASQSKVSESPHFELARLSLDSVRLWKLIRKSHLTHMSRSLLSDARTLPRRTCPKLSSRLVIFHHFSHFWCYFSTLVLVQKKFNLQLSSLDLGRFRKE